MKTATYTGIDGEKIEVSYDETFPCILCKQPVTEASMAGTLICPWCDCGKNRDGTPWTPHQLHLYSERWKKFQDLKKVWPKEAQEDLEDCHPECRPS